MRLPSAIAFLTLLTLVFAADAAPTPSPRQVDIPLGNGTLHAQLYKPEGDGPFPVVIALHGCGGVAGHFQSGEGGFRDWGGQFLEERKPGPLPGRDCFHAHSPARPVHVDERRAVLPPRRGAAIMA